LISFGPPKTDIHAYSVQQVFNEIERSNTAIGEETKPGNEVEDEVPQLSELLPKALYAAAAKGHVDVVSIVLSEWR
jgi:hypothetical protein